LPKEAAKRDALIRSSRLGCAVHVPRAHRRDHAQGDNLVMVMDIVDAQPIASKLHGAPLDKAEFSASPISSGRS
jgi:hypothetical protein